MKSAIPRASSKAAWTGQSLREEFTQFKAFAGDCFASTLRAAAEWREGGRGEQEVVGVWRGEEGRQQALCDGARRKNASGRLLHRPGGPPNGLLRTGNFDKELCKEDFPDVRTSV